MSSAKVDLFAKSASCPTTHQLLSYILAALSQESAKEIISHLEICDFCGAEVQLLSKHRISSSLVPDVPSEMPRHLRLLADSLLGKRASRSDLLAHLGFD